MLAITAFVLALVVPLLVALALIIYVRSALSNAVAPLSAQCSKLTSDFHDYSMRVDVRLSGFEKVSASHLAAELAVLAGDVEKLASSSRKQFGKLFAEVHHAGVLKRNRESQADIEDEPPAVDPELAALLALQAPVVKPNGAPGG